MNEEELAYDIRQYTEFVFNLSNNFNIEWYTKDILTIIRREIIQVYERIKIADEDRRIKLQEKVNSGDIREDYIGEN